MNDGLNDSFDDPVIHRNFQPELRPPDPKLDAAIAPRATWPRPATQYLAD
jgi:hypothetical protein